MLGRRVGGFDTSLAIRNKMLMASGVKPPRATKTGTTICGVSFGSGIVLGADTRATNDTLVADKNCNKIHYIAPNIHCCGAGTAADTEMVTAMIASQMQLLRLESGRSTRVITAVTRLKRHLFSYGGEIGAALVLGGVDATGAHLYTVYPHGSTDKLPYVSMGSGSLAAMAVLETGYKDGLTEEEAVLLVRNAIRAGIFNDLGSGSNVDLCVIRADGKSEMRRNFEKPNEVDELRAAYTRPKALRIPFGSTEVLKEIYTKFVTAEDVAPFGPGLTAGEAASGAAGSGGGRAGAGRMDTDRP